MSNNKINVSFSGGRSSALMLKILCENYDKNNLIVTFANTGKERPETLDFVKQCAEHFDIKIHWLEASFEGWRKNEKNLIKRKDATKWNLVNYETASRNGEPFESFINAFQYIPNSLQRMCTQKLKVELINKFLLEEYGLEEGEYDVALGIRKDEPKRYFKLKKENENRIFPLWDFGATAFSVRQFWASMPFDLQLKTGEGNCDMCFLKGINIRLWLARKNPELLVWWKAQERKIPKVAKEGETSVQYAQFDKAYSFAQIEKLSKTRRVKEVIDLLEEKANNPELFGEQSTSIGCFCGD